MCHFDISMVLQTLGESAVVGQGHPDGHRRLWQSPAQLSPLIQPAWGRGNSWQSLGRKVNNRVETFPQVSLEWYLPDNLCRWWNAVPGEILSLITGAQTSANSWEALWGHGWMGFKEKKGNTDDFLQQIHCDKHIPVTQCRARRCWIFHIREKIT